MEPPNNYGSPVGIRTSAGIINRDCSPYKLREELAELSRSLERGSLTSEQMQDSLLKMQEILAQLERQKRQLDLKEVQRSIALAAEQAREGRVDDDQGDFLDQLINQMDLLYARLENLQGVVSQSQDENDIDWKVHKYESVIRSLKEGLEGLLEEESAQAASGSSESLSRLGESPSSAGFVFLSYDPNREAKALLEHLKICCTEQDERYTQNNLERLRKGYETFVHKFRGALSLSPGNDNLLRIGEFFFTQVWLEPYCFEVVEKLSGIGLRFRKEKEPADLPAKIEWLLENMKQVPYRALAPLLNQLGNSARGFLNYDFDPVLQGNVVHVLYRLEGASKEVAAIGMGSPTIQTDPFRTIVNPEFKAFLTACGKARKRHLFVMNQSLLPKNGGLDETSRCQAVIHLEEQFRNTFFLIALNKNSDFYHQRGEFEKRDCARGFIDELIAQVFLKKPELSGNRIGLPVTRKLEGLEDWARAMAAQIYQKLFDQKGTLSGEERRIFIDLFYEELIKFLVISLDVDSFNISCKDGIDRSAATNAQLYANLAITSSKIHEPLQEKRIAALMLARAPIVRKRPPFSDRVSRFLECLKFTLKKKEQLVQLEETLFQEIGYLLLREE